MSVSWCLKLTGINGANTKTQRAQGIEDSIELFSSDCLKGGAKKPELVKILAANSGPDCDWLMDVFGLDLSLVARLGGHSAPRTHRGKERFPGMTITYALIQVPSPVPTISTFAIRSVSIRFFIISFPQGTRGPSRLEEFTEK